MVCCATGARAQADRGRMNSGDGNALRLPPGNRFEARGKRLAQVWVLQGVAWLGARDLARSRGPSWRREPWPRRAWGVLGRRAADRAGASGIGRACWVKRRGGAGGDAAARSKRNGLQIIRGRTGGCDSCSGQGGLVCNTFFRGQKTLFQLSSGPGAASGPCLRVEGGAAAPAPPDGAGKVLPSLSSVCSCACEPPAGVLVGGCGAARVWERAGETLAVGET